METMRAARSLAFAAALITVCAAGGGEAEKPEDQFSKLVTLKKPYKAPYKNAPTDKLSVQYAVIDLCRQIDANYNPNRSRDLAGDALRAWTRPALDDVPFRVAMKRVLPDGLGWGLENGCVVIGPEDKLTEPLPGDTVDAPPPAAGEEVFVAIDGSDCYHKPGCRHVTRAGQDKTRMAMVTEKQASEKGLRPCKVCNPPLRVNEPAPAVNETTEPVNAAPANVTETIRANAAAKWDGNFKMQKHEIERQTEALTAWNKPRPDDVPETVWATVREKAEEKWADNYVMRVHEQETQLTAWRDLQADE